jgi:hypothetical protein
MAPVEGKLNGRRGPTPRASRSDLGFPSECREKFIFDENPGQERAKRQWTGFEDGPEAIGPGPDGRDADPVTLAARIPWTVALVFLTTKMDRGLGRLVESLHGTWYVAPDDQVQVTPTDPRA